MNRAAMQIANTSCDKDGPVADRTMTTNVVPCARVLSPASIRAAFTVISDMADLDTLRDEWLALETEHGLSHQVFQSFHWVRHWCEHFLDSNDPSADTELCIVTARLDGRLVMIWPLVRYCRLGQCHIKWLGEPVSQYGDVLVIGTNDALELIHAGLDFISTALSDDIMILRKVRADSLVAQALTTRGLAATSTDEAPYATLPTDMDFDTFAKRYPSKARKNRRRHRRRLEEIGPVTFQVLKDCDKARAMIAIALDHKRRWLQDRSLVSRAFADKRLNGFFEAVSGSLHGVASETCEPHVFVLSCDDHPVAINVAFRSGDRMLAHIAAYDAEFERYSPGSLLFEASLEYCLEQGIHTFDFLSPGDPYKTDWADESVMVHDYALGLTRKGRAYDALFIRHLRPAAKYAMTRMPRLAGPFSRMFNS